MIIFNKFRVETICEWRDSARGETGGVRHYEWPKMCRRRLQFGIRCGLQLLLLQVSGFPASVSTGKCFLNPQHCWKTLSTRDLESVRVSAYARHTEPPNRTSTICLHSISLRFSSLKSISLPIITQCKLQTLSYYISLELHMSQVT